MAIFFYYFDMIGFLLWTIEPTFLLFLYVNRKSPFLTGKFTFYHLPSWNVSLDRLRSISKESYSSVSNHERKPTDQAEPVFYSNGANLGPNHAWMSVYAHLCLVYTEAVCYVFYPAAVSLFTYIGVLSISTTAPWGPTHKEIAWWTTQRPPRFSS